MSTEKPPKGRATEEELSKLHGLVAKYLIAKLEAWDNDPSNAANALTPAELAQAIKLLGENQINRPAFSGRKVKVATTPLPTADDEDNVIAMYKR